VPRVVPIVSGDNWPAALQVRNFDSPGVRLLTTENPMVVDAGFPGRVELYGVKAQLRIRLVHSSRVSDTQAEA
jgi:deoxycytidine triphosphate deaminase